jgi:hypothetical protein
MIARITERRVAAPLLAALMLGAAIPAKADTQDDAAAEGLDAALVVTGRLMLADTQGRVDDDIVDGSLVSLRLAPSLSLKRGDATFSLSNAATRVEYFAAGRTDRWQNVARLDAALDVGTATTLRLWGERSDNILTAEAPLADEWEVGAGIEQKLDDANRLSINARWRERRYDDVDQSRGNGPRVDAEYRYRFAPNHYAFLRGRYEAINSATARRDVQRWSATAAYQRPLARDLSLRPSLTWFDIEYQGRPVTGGGFRRDTVISPELSLSYSPGPWRFSADARYIARQSTDPQFDRSGYRFALEISHVF